MLAGYESHQWFEFGVAIVGAAAVLSGLLFVAMSINIERIMAIVTLPARAAGTLVLFVIPLMVGTPVRVVAGGTHKTGSVDSSSVVNGPIRLSGCDECWDLCFIAPHPAFLRRTIENTAGRSGESVS
jgi:hypothetical protein